MKTRIKTIKIESSVIMFDLIDIISNENLGHIFNESHNKPPLSRMNRRRNTYNDVYYDYEEGRLCSSNPPEEQFVLYH